MIRTCAAITGIVALTLLGGACQGGSGSTKSGALRVDGEALKCAWPMWGQNAQRTFAYPCKTEISRASAPRLVQQWFHRTKDVVTATPAVADGTIYVGDWSGTFYALSLVDGEPRWTFDAPKHANVYSGQIVASAAIADVSGERRVYFASGKTMYAARASDGRIRWKHPLNPSGGADDPTEIQSSPVVANGLVVFGFDGHDRPGVRAGVVALDAGTGRQRWYFDPDAGRAASGCNGIWSSPSVDTERGLVFVGSANCPSSPSGWGDYTEAIFALDLRTGAPKWHFQPRGPSNFDFDFAGAPNLFESTGRAAVGLGGKDGIYYALDRATGTLLWQVTASTPRCAGEELLDGRLHRADCGRGRDRRRRHCNRRQLSVPARHRRRHREDDVAAGRGGADVRREHDRERRRVRGKHDRLHVARPRHQLGRGALVAGAERRHRRRGRDLEEHRRRSRRDPGAGHRSGGSRWRRLRVRGRVDRAVVDHDRRRGRDVAADKCGAPAERTGAERAGPSRVHRVAVRALLPAHCAAARYVAVVDDPSPAQAVPHRSSR